MSTETEQQTAGLGCSSVDLQVGGLVEVKKWKLEKKKRYKGRNNTEEVVIVYTDPTKDTDRRQDGKHPEREA